MTRLLALSLLQNLLRLALQEINKLEIEIDSLSHIKPDVHRAFVAVSQTLDREINKRAPQTS